MTKKDIFKLYKPDHGPDVWIPVYMSAVQAGFPSPADLSKAFDKSAYRNFFFIIIFK